MRPQGRLSAEERTTLLSFATEAETLRGQIVRIAEAPKDSAFADLREVIGLYRALLDMVSDPKLMGALITEEEYDLLIGQANTQRNINLSLFLIEEAKAAHPFGRYASPKNCKHP